MVQRPSTPTSSRTLLKLQIDLTSDPVSWDLCSREAWQHSRRAYVGAPSQPAEASPSPQLEFTAQQLFQDTEDLADPECPPLEDSLPLRFFKKKKTVTHSLPQCGVNRNLHLGRWSAGHRVLALYLAFFPVLNLEAPGFSRMSQCNAVDFHRVNCTSYWWYSGPQRAVHHLTSLTIKCKKNNEVILSFTLAYLLSLECIDSKCRASEVLGST